MRFLQESSFLDHHTLLVTPPHLLLLGVSLQICVHGLLSSAQESGSQSSGRPEGSHPCNYDNICQTGSGKPKVDP